MLNRNGGDHAVYGLAYGHAEFAERPIEIGGHQERLTFHGKIEK